MVYLGKTKGSLTSPNVTSDKQFTAASMNVPDSVFFS